jgi:hypothetical protein
MRSAVDRRNNVGDRSVLPDGPNLHCISSPLSFLPMPAKVNRPVSDVRSDPHGRSSALRATCCDSGLHVSLGLLCVLTHVPRLLILTKTAEAGLELAHHFMEGDPTEACVVMTPQEVIRLVEPAQPQVIVIELSVLDDLPSGAITSRFPGVPLFPLVDGGLGWEDVLRALRQGWTVLATEVGVSQPSPRPLGQAGKRGQVKHPARTTNGCPTDEPQPRW